MSTTGQIILPRDNTNILSGSNLDVVVVIENHVQLLIKGIYLTFEGNVQVKWEDLISKNKNGEIIYFMQQFEGQEVYAKQQITVETSRMLTAGRHSYNLLVNIPSEIPETFNGKIGSVKYELMLLMHDNLGKQKLCTFPVTVLRCLNKLTKELMIPLTVIHRKYLCLRPCNSKPIITTLTLSSTSFIPGDIVKYYLLIENCSRYFNVHHITTVIIQTQKYKSLKPKQRIKQDHCSLYHKIHRLAGIPQNSSHYIKGSMQLSKYLVSTSIDPCLIMKSYKFQVIIIMNGLQTDVYITVPLIIRHHSSSHSMGDYVSNELRLQIEEEKPENKVLDHSDVNIFRASELIERII